MMRNKKSRICMVTLVLALLFCMPTASALPPEATMVVISGATLTALNPYWKNGGGGSADDWNLFFDTSTATPTLKMKDVVMNTINITDQHFLNTDGNIVIELYGTNVLSYTGAMPDTVIGLGSINGSITIRDGTGYGIGSLSITINNSAPFAYTIGIMTFGDLLLIESGVVNISVYDPGHAVALYAMRDISIQGGSTNLLAWGNPANTIQCVFFRLSGGTVVSAVNGTNADALNFSNAQFTGGLGLFSAVESGYGASWTSPDTGVFSFTGGHVIFSGGDGALMFSTNVPDNPDVAGDVFVSEFPSGLDKTLWNESMGLLASGNSSASDYRYVEMVGRAPVPQTGDAGRPWVWVFAGMLAAIGIAGLVLSLRKKRM